MDLHVHSEYNPGVDELRAGLRIGLSNPTSFEKVERVAKKETFHFLNDYNLL